MFKKKLIDFVFYIVLVYRRLVSGIFYDVLKMFLDEKYILIYFSNQCRM